MIYILIAKHKYICLFFYLDRIVAETKKDAKPQSTGPSSNNTFPDQNKEISGDSKILSELPYHVACYMQHVICMYVCYIYTYIMLR